MSVVDAHTNTIEGYFSILKRGIYGVYQHVSQQHLKRYLAEFDFRYNELQALGVGDVERTEPALRGIVGKRLTYLRLVGDRERRRHLISLMVMDTGQELRFYMEPYTPETLPLGRLADYLAELAKVLGDDRAVHLIELQEGSTVLINKVDPEALPKVYERAAAVKRGDAPRDAMDGYHKLNKMLQDDNGSGALLEPTGAEILDFPGRREDQFVFSWLEERGEVDGEVARVGGTSDPVPLLLQTSDGTLSGCYARRTIAKQLGQLLFEPVRLRGIGYWARTRAGRWILNRFNVENFEKLDAEPLSTEILRLRAIDVDWGDNAIDELLKLRRGDNGEKRNGGV